MNSVGDLSRFLASSRFQAHLQQRMDTAAQALSTGLVGDKARHLSSDTLSLSLLDRKIELLGQQSTNLKESNIFIGIGQSALGKIQSTLEDVGNRIPIASQGVTSHQVDLVSQAASAAFVEMIDTLNVRAGARFVFAGAATDRKPLPNGTAVLQQLVADLNALPVGANIESEIDDWFNNPSGPFLGTFYSGSSGQGVSLPTSNAHRTDFPVSASSQAIRDGLTALAGTIAVGALSSRLSQEEQEDLLRQSQDAIHSATDDVVGRRTEIGFIEERLALAQSETSSELSELSLDKAELIAADEYTEISNFENAQQRLDILYRIAARQSQTSLAEYMR